MTQLLRDWQQGDAAAGADLVSTIYAELKRLAASRLRQERQDHTLQPTALIHEAYMRLADQRLPEWQNRSHFFEIGRASCRERV